MFILQPPIITPPITNPGGSRTLEEEDFPQPINNNVIGEPTGDEIVNEIRNSWKSAGIITDGDEFRPRDARARFTDSSGNPITARTLNDGYWAYRMARVASTERYIYENGQLILNPERYRLFVNGVGNRALNTEQVTQTKELGKFARSGFGSLFKGTGSLIPAPVPPAAIPVPPAAVPVPPAAVPVATPAAPATAASTTSNVAKAASVGQIAGRTFSVAGICISVADCGGSIYQAFKTEPEKIDEGIRDLIAKKIEEIKQRYQTSGFGNPTDEQIDVELKKDKQFQEIIKQANDTKSELKTDASVKTGLTIVGGTVGGILAGKAVAAAVAAGVAAGPIGWAILGGVALGMAVGGLAYLGYKGIKSLVNNSGGLGKAIKGFFGW